MDRELKGKLHDNSDCISEETIYKYIDKKLSARKEHLIEKHLIDCELCSDAIDGLSLLKNRNRINEINTAIKEQLSQGKGRADLRIIISVAAGILLLVGGVFLFNQFVGYNKENTVALKTLPVEENDITQAPHTESSEQRQDKSLEIKKSADQEKKDFPKKTDKDPDKTITTIHTDEVLEETKFSELADAKDESGYAQKDDNQPDQDLKNAPVISNTPPVSGTTAMEQISKKDTESINDKSETKTKKQGQVTTGKTSTKKNKYESKSDSKKESNNIEVTTSIPPALSEEKNQIADIEQSTDQSKKINDSLISFTGETEKVYSVVDEMPAYPGGQESLIKYIRQNLHIPAGNYDNTITTILIQFIVDSKGKASKAKLMKPDNKELEKQIIDMISKMPQWAPGKLNGREVNVIYNLPVKVNTE